MASNKPLSSSTRFEKEKNVVLELCRKQEKGVDQAIITAALSYLAPADLMIVLNDLSSSGKVQIFQTKNSLVYQLKNSVAHEKLKGTTREDKVVFSIIESHGGAGIWSRDLKLKCNLYTATYNKIMKRLLSKGYVNKINTPQDPRKTIFIAASVEPNIDLSKSPLLDDKILTDALLNQCYRYMVKKLKDSEALLPKESPLSVFNKAKVTTSEMIDYITETQAFKVKLEEHDMEQLLRALCYEGRAKKFEADIMDGSRGSVLTFRAMINPVDEPAITRTPCGVCTLINRCGDLGEITPLTCPYLTDWLGNLKPDAKPADLTW